MSGVLWFCIALASLRFLLLGAQVAPCQESFQAGNDSVLNRVVIPVCVSAHSISQTEGLRMRNVTLWPHDRYALIPFLTLINHEHLILCSQGNRFL